MSGKAGGLKRPFCQWSVQDHSDEGSVSALRFTKTRPESGATCPRPRAAAVADLTTLGQRNTGGFGEIGRFRLADLDAGIYRKEMTSVTVVAFFECGLFVHPFHQLTPRTNLRSVEFSDRFLQARLQLPIPVQLAGGMERIVEEIPHELLRMSGAILMRAVFVRPSIRYDELAIRQFLEPSEPEF